VLRVIVAQQVQQKPLELKEAQERRVIVALQDLQERQELKEALAHQEGKERGVWQVLLVIVAQQVQQEPQAPQE
jgi:hypothetical protein